MSVSTAAASPLIDRDFDGLDDRLEMSLIERHRPVLAYHRNTNLFGQITDEAYWPISAENFVRNSELVWEDQEGSRVVYTREDLSRDPSLALQGHRVIADTPSATIGAGPGYGGVGPGASTTRSNYYLDIANSARPGVFPGLAGETHEGMYAHVVPHEIGGAPKILLQFWQLFAYNDSTSEFGGSHEGDWLYIDLILAPTPPHILESITYYHHGSQCPPTVVAPGDPHFPSDGIPICFIEFGAHEWWPFAAEGNQCDWTGFVLPGHNGRGIRYRVPEGRIENLGERTRPMPGSLAASLVLGYNGQWGRYGQQTFFFSAEPAKSPLYQFGRAIPAPKGLERVPANAPVVMFNRTGVWGLPLQPVDLNDSNQFLFNANPFFLYPNQPASRPMRISRSLRAFSSSKQVEELYVSPRADAHAIATALTQSGHVGGRFGPGVIWWSPTAYEIPRLAGPAQEPNWDHSLFSLWSTPSGTTGLAAQSSGWWGPSFFRYRSGVLSPITFENTPVHLRATGLGSATAHEHGLIGLYDGLTYLSGWMRGTMSHDRVTGSGPVFLPAAAYDVDESGNVVGQDGHAVPRAALWPAASPASTVVLWAGGQASAISERGVVIGTWGYPHVSWPVEPDYPVAGARRNGAIMPLLRELVLIDWIQSPLKVNSAGFVLLSEARVRSSDPMRPAMVDLRSRSVPAVASSIQACSGSVVVLGARVGGLPPDTNTWRWYRNGEPVADGTLPHGTIVSGSSTSRLVLSNVSPLDTGYFQFVGGDPQRANVLGPTLADPTFLTVVPSIPLVIEAHPGSVAVPAGQPFVLATSLRSGFDTASVRWQRNGIDIVDGPEGASAGGGVVSGAQTAVFSDIGSAWARLFIQDPQPSDAGQYVAVLTNPCGSVTSVPATVTIVSGPSACNPADITGIGGPPATPDGILTGDDFNAFIAAFASGCP